MNNPREDENNSIEYLLHNHKAKLAPIELSSGKLRKNKTTVETITKQIYKEYILHDLIASIIYRIERHGSI